MAATEEKPAADASEKGYLSDAWKFVVSPVWGMASMVAGNDDEKTGPSEKGWLSETWDTATSFAISPLYGMYKAAGSAYDKVTTGVGSMQMAYSDKPAEFVLDKLAETEQFKGEEGQQEIQKIRDDKDFMAALDKAIKNDDTVRTGLAGMATGNGYAIKPDTLAGMLTDPTQREVLTQVLDKAGESGSDKLNFAWMTDIAGAAGENDMAKVQELLAQGGIKNDMVDMAADPTQIFGLALKDSKAFGQSMSKMMGLEGEQAKAFSGIFEFLAKFLQMIWGNVGDPNSIAHFVDKYGPGMQETFEDFTGITDQRRAEANNDNPDINVTQSSRPTGSFNNAANGATPASNPEAAPAEPTFVERYAQAQMNAARYGMAM